MNAGLRYAVRIEKIPNKKNKAVHLSAAGHGATGTGVPDT
jgi:hypothetical protein